MEENNIECLEFACKISKNVVEYRCEKKEKRALMEYSFIDSKLPKSYLVLLRTSVDKLIEKKYEKIVQTVTEDDWENFLKKDKWKLVAKMKSGALNCCIVECDIADALGCISRGLGL
ncbi:MAG: hypothetical protein Harvfovirus24_10 [Harvfovirus sp.]|uniref:Uncharacterized protein n=1 Tax=Harvfovirus sp. TaxID=2487768 RepID=A0A3G5A468_9VIRU|nr:MAG: hypothetical protein Harvfovirus24_10 [Harvfovirus sp.]